MDEYCYVFTCDTAVARMWTLVGHGEVIVWSLANENNMKDQHQLSDEFQFLCYGEQRIIFSIHILMGTRFKVNADTYRLWVFCVRIEHSVDNNTKRKNIKLCSDCQLVNGTPHLALTRELWGVFSEVSWGNGTARYIECIGFFFHMLLCLDAVSQWASWCK